MTEQVDEASQYDPHLCATQGCNGLAAMTYLGRPVCRECWNAQCADERNATGEVGDVGHLMENQEPLEQENTMSKKKSKKTTATQKSAKGGTKGQPTATKRPPVATKAKGDAKAATPKAEKANEVKPKRVSSLDAAARVLKAAGKPMRSQDLIVAMTEQGLWTSPKGKTPHATLYAAMMREKQDKGKESRFTKVDRGLFAFNG